MNYCFNWLVAYLYRNRLIDRNEFMRQWGNIQKLKELMEL
jgi:hypothetical protein